MDMFVSVIPCVVVALCLRSDAPALIHAIFF
jgi:hypothetical protein